MQTAHHPELGIFMSTQTDPNPDPNVLERLRVICLALPEAYETESFSHPCWRVAKKTFACYEPYGGEYVVNFKTEILEQDRLVSGSDDYFVAPYTGRHGWVCLKQSRINWAQLEPMLIYSYRMNAPKKLARLVNSDAG